MLTQQEKDKIKAEEIFRSEIVKEFDSKKDSERVWKVLNSPFTLFLISTMFISFGTFIYSKWEKSSVEKQLKVKQVKRLDLEIQNRFRYYHTQTFFTYMDTKDALLILENPQESKFPSGVFYEFKNRTIASLLLELESLVPDKEKNEISQALSGAFELGKIYATLSKKEKSPLWMDHGPIDFSKINALGDIYKITSSNFNLDRWGKPFELGLEWQKSPEEQAKKDRKDFVESYLGEDWAIIKKDKLKALQISGESTEQTNPADAK